MEDFLSNACEAEVFVNGQRLFKVTNPKIEISKDVRSAVTTERKADGKFVQRIKRLETTPEITLTGKIKNISPQMVDKMTPIRE